MIQHLFGIRPLRQTMRDVEVNAAYRRFLGYTMSQPLPRFETVSYASRHRFTAEVIKQVFRWILKEEINSRRYFRFFLEQIRQSKLCQIIRDSLIQPPP